MVWTMFMGALLGVVVGGVTVFWVTYLIGVRGLTVLTELYKEQEDIDHEGES